MAITKVGDLTFDQAAWELKAYYALRPQLPFIKCATVKPTNQAHPGSSVKFNIVSDIAAQTTALDESTDVTPVTMADGAVTVTLAEQGAAVQDTALVRGTSFVPFDPIVANVVGFSAGLSMDTIIRDVAKAGDNVRYMTTAVGGQATSRATTIPTDTLKAAAIRRARVDLVSANVMPYIGELYAAYVHPDGLYDLRAETGAAAWRDPHTYSQPDEIWKGIAGTFEGFMFNETNRAPIFADSGSSTTLTDVYGSLFMGQEALACAWSTVLNNGPMPNIVPSPVTDKLRRFTGMGWYWLGGFAVFRQAALRRVEHASSIGTNA